MTIFVFLTAALLIIIIRIIVFSIGAARQRELSAIIPDVDKKYVSVIIPARNEEENIERCIHSVSANNYPIDKYEIIAVDDRSTDNTYAILNKLKSEIKNLRIVQIKDPSDNKNLQGKPGALQAGIEMSIGEILLFTDADCIVQKEWIETMSACYDDGTTALAASYTSVKSKTIFEKLQSMEWIYMHSLASAGLGINQPLGCFGNNLSIKSLDFWQAGSYKNIDFSVTEDLALLQRIFDSGKKAVYLCHPKAVVETLALKTFKEYLHQHHRWSIGGLNLGWRATFFVASSAALWIGLILSLIAGEYYWTLAFLLVRTSGDFSLLAPTLEHLELERLIKWIPPASVFFMLLEILVPFLLFKKDINWKGQKLTNKSKDSIRNFAVN